VAFDLNKTSIVSVAIYNMVTNVNLYSASVSLSKSQNPSRLFQQTLAPGHQIVSWDGRDAFGDVVDDGLFVYEIKAEAALGRTNAYAPSYVFGVVSWSNVGVGTNFNFQANEPCAISYSLYAPAFVFLGKQESQNPHYMVPGLPQTSGPHTEYWDGRYVDPTNLCYGPFTIFIVTQLLPENAIVARRQGAQIITDLQTESYLIKPSLSEVSEIHYTLAENSVVDVKVTDPNGNLITVLNQASQSSGNHVAEWRGHYDTNTIVGIQGDYEVTVTAQSLASGLQHTRTANISIR
jgi:flagellar hook assembly protein FlgD